MLANSSSLLGLLAIYRCVRAYVFLSLCIHGDNEHGVMGVSVSGSLAACVLLGLITCSRVCYVVLMKETVVSLLGLLPLSLTCTMRLAFTPVLHIRLLQCILPSLRAILYVHVAVYILHISVFGHHAPTHSLTYTHTSLHKHIHSPTPTMHCILECASCSVAVLMYNVLAMKITLELDSVTRNILDTLRTVFIWVLVTLIHYYISTSFGESLRACWRERLESFCMCMCMCWTCQICPL